MSATGRPPSRRLAGALLLAGALVTPGGPGVPLAAAQESQSPACCATFDYLLEKTIFKVDAVRLQLDVEGDTPGLVADLVRGRDDARPVQDSVAAVYMSAERADVRMTFLRSFGLQRFLDANRGVLQSLVPAGILTDEEFRILEAENRVRFSGLAEDGIRDGDRLEHEVRGDSVSTRYTDVAGSVRIDEVKVSSAHRRAMLGSLFGPGSDFRKGLLRQVFERAAATGSGE